MLLTDLKPGDKAYIVKVKGRGSFRKRIIEMGFIRGEQVEYVQQAPLNDPIIFKILGYEVTLRKSEAALIEIQNEPIPTTTFNNSVVSINQEKNSFNGDKSKVIHVALVGNPNCGKTTLFNYCTGLSERVGNYGGVTVDIKKGLYKYNGYTFEITDLPGTYSLSAYSPEELFVRNYLTTEFPDVVINIVDASNLERNLYLTTQLIDMDMPVVMALNMYDELQKKGDQFNYDKLGKMIGVPIIPTVSTRGRGIFQLFNEVIAIYENRSNTYRHIHIHYGQNIENAISDIQHELKKNKSLLDQYSSRFLSLKLLENDKDIHQIIEKLPNGSKILSLAQKHIQNLEKDFGELPETIIADAKYGFISGALAETYKKNKDSARTISKKIDAILINRILGLPIFFIFLWFIFETTFFIGQYPVHWIEQSVEWLGNLTETWLPSGIFKDLLSDGIIQGVGGVLVFLPNILLLFFFISIMEDTGYMARVAFLMDKIMHKMGLHGKSFIPLFMGFGCNVPAIMATRTIESHSDRLVTILVNPLMSCSARLPIYVLFAGTFFGKHAGTAIFIIYLSGIVLAALLSLLLKKTLFNKNEIPFVMELPPYRIPTYRNILKHMWHKAKQYLKKMSGIILFASIIIWSLSYFPTSLQTNDLLDKIVQLEKKNNLPANSHNSLNQLKNKIYIYQLENSYLANIGRFIEPIMMPLGFDWRISVSLIAGITGKEVVVSTLAVLFNNHEENFDSLSNNLKAASNYKQQPLFTLPVIVAFLAFVLIYFPCIAVIASIKKETAKWKWAIYVIFFSTLLAWSIAFILNSLISWLQ
ncbi:MAG: ferrous iron transport protein B [Bacteroidales bacterium]|nr:ferrous iron transport protein B [Bacteroidales bacterium]